MSTASFVFVLFCLFVVFSTTNHQVLDRCKSFWTEADKKNDGNTNVMEFARLLREKANISDHFIAEVFADLDTDDNWVLSYEELCEVFEQPTCLQREEILKATFHSIDKDKSGFLSMAEIRSAYVKMGYDLSDSTVNDFYSTDQDGNGLISLDEFFTQFEITC